MDLVSSVLSACAVFGRTYHKPLHSFGIQNMVPVFEEAQIPHVLKVTVIGVAFLPTISQAPIPGNG